VRHPPAFQIEIRTGRAWVWCLIVLVALSIASALAWAVLLWQRQNVLWPLFTVGLWVLAAIYLELRRAKAEPRSLRWDGQQWLFAVTKSPGTDMRAGELQILLDFGDWLLLRFAEAAPYSFRRRRHYLGLSRADLAGQWHILRSTLYSSAVSASRSPLDAAPH
jgi:hypothetical protein